MKQLSEKIYIEAAYNIMKNEGLEKISIRKIAKVLDCSSAALYKYFDGLDQLILYASIRYLLPYIKDLNKKLKPEYDALTKHFIVWDAFAFHSFNNIKVFNHMFFSHYSDNFNHIVSHYYCMFEAEVRELEDMGVTFSRVGDFYARDMVMVNSCVNEGFFKAEDAELINKLGILIYMGAAKELLDKSNLDKKLMRKKFMRCMRAAIMPFVQKESTTLDTVMNKQ